MHDGWVSGDELEALFANARESQLRAIEALAVFERTKAWDLEGAASAASWLVARCALTRADAERTVASARVLDAHDGVRAATEARAVTPAHLAQFAQLARHRSGTFTEFVPTLVEAASALDPESFRTVARRWKTYADDALAPSEFDTPNWLEFRQTFQGSWRLEGVFDPAHGAAIHNAIAELAQPRAGDDLRPAAERRADALFAAMFDDGRIHARVDVVIDVDSLTPPASIMSNVMANDTARPAPQRDLVGSGPITQRVFEHLACDARVSRVLMRGRSEVLDLGRAARLASPAQRRAVVRRDECCVWPGCDRPPHMCDVHHLVPWHEGGETNLANLALVCGHHHHRIHDDWKLTRLDTGGWDVAPP